MKKILAPILATMVLLASCGKPAGDADTTASPDTTKTPETTVAPEVEKRPDAILDIEKVFNDINCTAASDSVKVQDVETKYIKKTVDGKTYISIEEPRMVLSGFPFQDTNFIKYYRLEAALFNQYPVSPTGGDSVQKLAHHSSGGRIRFKTDATEITIEVTTKNASRMQHMTWVGSMGCDVYVGSGTNRIYVDSVQPYSDTSRSDYTRTITLPAGMKEVTINLPLYAGIQSMNVGFATGSQIGSPDPYTIEKPIVFYGHSMTQGCSASRPGMSYPQIVTRALDANLVNMGFSGSAKGEQIVIDSIAKIDMSAFVMDYDYNATVDILRSTHYNVYKTVRDAHPDIPIIMVSAANRGYKRSMDEVNTRIGIIMDTYNKAKAAGDDNVYFLNGSDIVPDGFRGDMFIDNTHMNDFGMYLMANSLYPVLKETLAK